VSSPTNLSVLVVIIIAAIIALSKLRKTLRGWKVKRIPIFGITMVYLGLAAYFAISSFIIGIPIIYLLVYIAAFIISQFVSYHYADRSLSFWKTPDGSIYSKGGLLIHIAYIVSVVLRFTISLVFIGSKSFQFHIQKSTQLASQSEMVGVAIIVVDTSMIFGLGLLVGMNRRLLRLFSFCI